MKNIFSKCNLFVNSKSDYVSFIVFIISAAFFAYLLSFRDVMYSDNKAYMNAFGQVVKYVQYGQLDLSDFQDIFLVEITSTFEFLYYCFNFIVALLSSEYRVFVWCHCFFFILLLMLAYQRYHKNSLFIVLLIFATLSTYSLFGNVLRQASAVPFFVFATTFLTIYKSNRWFLFYILLGALFHTSILVFLLLPFMSKWRAEYLIVTLLTIIFMSLIGLTSILLGYFEAIPILAKFAIYLSKSGVTPISVNFVSPILTVFVLYIFSRKSPDINIILRVYLSILIVQYLFVTNFIVFTRIGLYRNMLEPILLLSMISTFSANYRLPLYLMLFVVLVCYFFVFTFPEITSKSGLFPYI